MDKALDDVVREKNISFRGTRKSSGGGLIGQKPNRGRGAGNQMRNNNLGMRSFGGIAKSASRQQQPQFMRRPPPSDGPWIHDMYEGYNDSYMNRPAGGMYSNVGGAAGSGYTRLFISNLDFGVSNDDIQELFSEFGPIVKHTVHYDFSGRSLGTAEVLYRSFNSAQAAKKQYSNVPLDGKPMHIEISSQGGGGAAGRMSAGQSVNVLSRLSPMKPRGFAGAPRMMRGGGGGGGRGQGRGAGRRRGGGGGGGAMNGAAPSKEDLDAELDSYKTSSGGATEGKETITFNGGGRRGGKAVPSKDDLDAELDSYRATV